MLNDAIFGLLGFNLFAWALVLLRGPIFRTRLYRPMVKNLILSIFPILLLVGGLVASIYARVLVNATVAIIVAILFGLMWLLMLPNAGYLITELNMSHRREGESVPIWFDVILVITLAMSGVINTVFNILGAQFVYALIRFRDEALALREPEVIAVVVALHILVAFGIYLGRSRLRLYSWDVLNPFRLARTIFGHLRTHLGEAIGFTFTYALFLGLIYVVMVGPLITGLVLLEHAR